MPIFYNPGRQDFAPDYLIYKKGGVIIAKPSKINDNPTFSGTDAATVIQDVFDRINTLGGGSVHIKGYSKDDAYEITTSIKLPRSGHLTLTGDGAEWTVLEVPSGSDNDIFTYSDNGSAPTEDAFFSRFSDFQLRGDRVLGTNNTGFRLDSSDFGFVDTVWERLFILNFANDGILMNAQNCWNNQIVNCTLEHCNNYMLERLAGSDTRVENCKFLFSHGTAAILARGIGLSLVNCWFYKNDKHGIWMTSAAAGTVISNCKFQNNGLLTDDTYDDIFIDAACISSVITCNSFGGSTQANKTRYAVNISDANSSDNQVSLNNCSPYASGSFGSTPIIINSGALSNLISNNIGVDSAGDGWKTVYKTADETIASDATLSDDADLKFPVDANSDYTFIMFLHVTSNTTADFKYAFTQPSGSFGRMKSTGDWDAVNSTGLVSIDASTAVVIGSATEKTLEQHGRIITGSTAGTIQLQWAQNTSDAGNTTLEQGSIIMWKKMDK